MFIVFPFSHVDHKKVHEKLDRDERVEVIYVGRAEARFFLVDFGGITHQLSEIVGFGEDSSDDPNEERIPGIVVQTEEIGGYAPTGMWEWISQHE